MAIQVGGTTVIDNSRVLQNVTGLKTINNTSILGSGNISAGGFTWSADQSGFQTLTGIPSGTREIVIVFDGIVGNTNFTYIDMRIGDSGGVESGGYVSYRSFWNNNTSAANLGEGTGTGGIGHWRIGHYLITGSNTSGVCNLYSDDGRSWYMNSIFGSMNNNASGFRQNVITGKKTLSGDLDRIQLFLNSGSYSSGFWKVGYR